MNADYHSTFTPSESDPGTLEYLFVAREALARGIMDGILESARSGDKQQRLVIGPRGIGKTHFVALIYHRVRANTELMERLRIAWLREDLYVASYPDLLLEILRKLAREYQEADLAPRLESILDLAGSVEQEAALERLLLESLGGRTLLLITENLDDLLRDLKEEGQRKLRAYVQNHLPVTILATATSLVDAVAERRKTFYGFFRLTPLEPFDVQQARLLLARLAEREHKADLVDAIHSSMGYARIQAIHYLAGGNPRIYVLFYDFLNRDTLDDLKRPFMKLVDELTPYYQARMSRLSPLQRRIIDVLRQLRGASTVTAIARQAMNSPQSVSTQLGKLRELGYVIQVDSVGRSNYYELREPLMRMCLEVKEQQGRTVELFVQFLRVWYSEAELDRLASAGAGGLEEAHLFEAVRRARSEQDPLQTSLANEFFRHQNTGNHEQALEAAEVAIERAPGLKENWVRKAQCLAALDRRIEELECRERVTEIDPEDWQAWNSQSSALSALGRFEDAVGASRRAVELKPDQPILARNYSTDLAMVGRDPEARKYREEAVALSGEPVTAVDWDQRGMDLSVLNRMDEALSAYLKAVELDPRRTEAWNHLWGWLQEQGRYRLIHKMVSRMVALFPQQPVLHSKLGTAHAHLTRYEEALTAYENALKLDPELDQKGEPVSLYRALTLSDLGREQQALEALEQCKPQKSVYIEFRFDLARARILMSLGRWEEGRSELDRLLESYPPMPQAGKAVEGFVSAPLEKSSTPRVWRQFITTWLASFGRHQRLAELGQGLVRSLRALILSSISNRAARDWCETWEELAGAGEEMALPLRLLAAGVEYRADRDPRALLRLAREERGLLEPWLANLLEEEPSEIDGEMEALLRTAEQRVAEEAEAERARVFWESPRPDLEDLDFARLLNAYGDRPSAAPASLLPGEWQNLGRSEAERLLRQVAAQADIGARAWSRPELRILGIDRRSVGFSKWSLYQVHLSEGDRVGAIDVIASESRAFVLIGPNPTLYDLIKDGAIRLKDADSQSEYTRFYCNVARGEEGRFQIVEGPADLQLNKDKALPTELSIQPWELTGQPVDDSGPTFTGTVLYAGALFLAQIRLNSVAQGVVEIIDDKPLVADLAVRGERFDGPIRFLNGDGGGQQARG